MQWWSNPSARSHLEAWVNIWVRSAGLALVLAGWLLVRAKREGDVFGIAVFRPSFFLFAFLFFFFLCTHESKLQKVQSVLGGCNDQKYCIF